MKLHELANELRCKNNDVQRMCHELDISAPTPSTELSADNVERLRLYIEENGILTSAVANAKRAAAAEPAESPVTESTRNFADLPTVTLRPKPPAQLKAKAVARILAHEEYEEWLVGPHDIRLKKRVNLIHEQILTRGVPTAQKPTTGVNKGWKRTHLGGSNRNQHYLYWARHGADVTEGYDLAKNDVLLRAVRHHDETDVPLSQARGYAELQLKDAVARPDEEAQPYLPTQIEIVHGTAEVQLISGHPGSGKTTVLSLIARQCPPGRALYLTHSKRLAVEARRDLDVFTPADAEFSVLTFSDLLSTVGDAVEGPTIAEMIDRLQGAWKKFPGKHNSWQGKPELLFAELHAHVVGGAYAENPTGFAAAETPIAPQNEYLARRSAEIGPRPAENAWKFASWLVERGLLDAVCPWPVQAWNACNQLSQNNHSLIDRIGEVELVLVDEVQDLTTIEQILLLELIAQIALKQARMPRVAIAGDEAQTVRPTDFDWGRFKRLVTDRLGLHPQTHALTTNVRSPSAIAHIVNQSWELYFLLPKTTRPAGQAKAERDDGAHGHVVQCQAASKEELHEFIKTCAESFNVQWIYPGLSVPVELLALDAGVQTSGDVKGLGFEIVGVIDAGIQIQDIHARATSADAVERLWARSLGDHMRVCFSRSTDTLILIESQGDVARNSLVQLCRGEKNQESPPGYRFDVDHSDLLRELDAAHALTADRAHSFLGSARKFIAESPADARRYAYRAVKLVRDATADISNEHAQLCRDVEALYGLSLVADAISRPFDAATDADLRAAEAALTLADAVAAVRLAKALAFACAAQPALIAKGLKQILEILDDPKASQEFRDIERAVEKFAFARCRILGSADAATNWQSADTIDGAFKRARGLSARLKRVEELTAYRDQHIDSVANLWIQEGKFDEASQWLARRSRPDPRAEAQCHEGRGEWQLAARQWELAGNLTKALACARQVPDLKESLRLAALAADHHASARLLWLQALLAAADEPDPVLQSITTAERDWAIRAITETLEKAVKTVTSEP